MGIGLHLLVDGMTATPPTTDDVNRFVSAVVKQVGLHIISGPFFYNLESHQEAFTIVAESHVSVQWWDSGLVLVDLFSCKPFDGKVTAEFIVKAFGLEFYDSRTIKRMGVG